MIRFLKKQPAVRFITLGFLMVILIGSGLLMLPISIKDGMHVSYIDALYTSTSAVCVTGLIAIDTADYFTLFGQIVVCLLIQIGGLGVSAIGAWIILAISHKINLKEISIVKEALNLHSGHGMNSFLKELFLTTIIIETLGALINFIVFIGDYSVGQAIWLSIFHSVASFNNSGFDAFGGGVGLTGYQDNILLNINTSLLIILGGLGFLVIRELRTKRFHWKRLSMHSRVVLTMSALLLFLGTILIKIAEDSGITWLGAFFFSVSSRTAGFSTFPVGNFRDVTLLVIIVLMFIGASPGSTGGGIKTTTFFVLLQGLKSSATNRQEKAFHYSIPSGAFKKASVLSFLAISLIVVSTFLMLMFEPHLSFLDCFFEMTSAFGTVGLSTGITPSLTVPSKLLSILMMYIGRLGPLTIVTLWNFNRVERFSYPEGNISIG